jgi:hypothetical protein
MQARWWASVVMQAGHVSVNTLFPQSLQELLAPRRMVAPPERLALKS